MKNYSTTIAQAIEEHLEEMDVHLVAFDETEGAFGFVMNLLGEIAFVPYIIKVHEDDYTVVARCPVSPTLGDATAATAMAEFLCRANHRLRNGNFEMDFDEGELRYKCFVNCDGQIPSPSIIRDSIATPGSMIMHYAPGIINVLYRGMDPKRAVSECEGPKIQVRLLEAAERALQAMRKKQCSNDESDGISEEEIDALLGMLDDMDEDALMREIAGDFADAED